MSEVPRYCAETDHGLADILDNAGRALQTRDRGGRRSLRSPIKREPHDRYRAFEYLPEVWFEGLPEDTI
jgi:hypothetical protein